MSTQIYTIPPSKELERIAKSFFVMEHTESDLQEKYLLPDGLPSFFHLSVSEDIHAHFLEVEEKFVMKSGLYVGYANTLMKFTHKEMKIIGVSVFPIYMSILLGSSLSELMNKFIPVGTVIKNNMELDILQNASPSDPEELIQLIERFIIGRIRQNPVKEEILDIYKLIIKSKGNEIRLDDLTNKTGYSARHINNLFQKHLGMAPKQLIKLARFNYGLKLIGELNKDKNLTQIAIELGYYDQAHFIKDFKSVCGKTPGELLAEKDDFHKNFNLY
ncbi:hypothetical protein AB832_04560 [Flavobacteriaceae bacterium (ex Bugula neritina AB1)]|nr:hypothetical protein AB832_04560 [Flavobacteriaceae bacterium (ex Bugula neritina AB1)]